MKTYQKILGVVCGGFFIFMMITQVDVVHAATKESLIKKVKKQTTEPVRATYYADYDGNGKKELFAITGVKDWEDFDSPYVGNHLWFASNQVVKDLSDDIEWGTDLAAYYNYVKKPVCKVFSKQKLFVMEWGAGGSGSISTCHYVKNGIPYAVNGRYEGLSQLSGKQFAYYPSAYDHCSDGTGHTYKKYYLKWTGSSFKTYTAKKISTSALKKYDGADAVLKKVKKAGYTVKSIYLRQNNLIHINLERKDTYCSWYENVTLKIKDNKVSPIVINKDGKDIVEKCSYGGLYEEEF